MGILSTILIGLVAGIIGRFLIPGKTPPSSIIMTTILGILGALLAGYLGEMLGIYAVGEKAGLLGAVVGAIIVLLIYGKFRKKT